MKRAFFAIGLLAVAARVTGYVEPGTTAALVSFGVFWTCAFGYLVAHITS